MTDHEKTLDMIFGRWRSQILYAGVKLGVFDCVNSFPKNVSDIAKQLNLDRALGSLGLLREDVNRNFSITAQGELLGKDHPQTQRNSVVGGGGRTLCPLETFTLYDYEWETKCISS
jgi:hypothetical protein